MLQRGRQSSPRARTSATASRSLFGGAGGGGPAPSTKSRLYSLGALSSCLILCSLYYMNSASRMNLLQAPSNHQGTQLALASSTAGGLSLTQRDTLASIIQEMKAELALYEDEIPSTFMKKTITTPFHGEIEDTHQVVNEACPRYVTMMKPGHGMGHQMGTFTTAMITALFFNLTYVDSPYSDASFHGNYPGIADFTGLGEGEHKLEEVEKKVRKVVEVREMPIEPTSYDLKVLYEPLRKVFEETHGKECNVLFKVSEHYSMDYGSFTKAIVSRKFREAPHRKPIELLYDPREFSVAIHIRVGDITPTSEAYFLRVFSQMLPVLKESAYRVHAFAEKKGAGDYPGLVAALGDRLVFHPDMPPFETFYHLTQAHVFIMSASGFSQFPAIAGTKALVFSPPSRESFPLKFCPPYAVCCNKEGGFELEGVWRLEWRRDRWMRTLKLRQEIKALEEMTAVEE